MYTGTPLTDRRHRTLCRVDGQPCQLFRDEGDGTVIVEWLADQPGADRAAAAGLVPSDPGATRVTVAADRVHSPFVHAEDEPGPVWPAFPAPAMFGDPVEPAGSGDAVAGLATALEPTLPDGWQEVVLDCRALGTRLEVTVTVSTARGEVPAIPSSAAVEWLRRLRAVSHTPERGAWTTARYRLGRGGGSAFDTGHEPPTFAHVRVAGQFREHLDELRYFPRERAAAGWLLAPATRYHREQRELDRTSQGRARFALLRHGIRLAETFDGTGADGRPVAYRTALPSAEQPLVLDYLRAGRPVVSAFSTEEDVLDPARPPAVPNQWLTDGVWVWPAAMAYYLEHHGIVPPAALLDHLRGHGYAAPAAVADGATDRARDAVMGGRHSADDSADGSGDDSVDEVVGLVREVVAGLRIGRRYYSFHSPVEGGWTMLVESDGWWSVFCTVDGVRKEETRFPRAMDAAAHLIGCLTLSQEQCRRDPAEVLEDHECLMRPGPSDPPLSAYDDKLHVVLAPGTELDRVGEPAGTTAYAAGTPRERRLDGAGTVRRYRVQAAFQAVTGRTRPTGDTVGGGVAYVLPRPLTELVADGWLAESPLRGR